MLNVNNNASIMKQEILVKIAKLQLEGKLEEGVHYIPKEMVPKGSQPVGCCIAHDREIMRTRVLARMGFSVENYDEEKQIRLVGVTLQNLINKDEVVVQLSIFDNYEDVKEECATKLLVGELNRKMKKAVFKTAAEQLRDKKYGTN